MGFFPAVSFGNQSHNSHLGHGDMQPWDQQVKMISALKSNVSSPKSSFHESCHFLIIKISTIFFHLHPVHLLCQLTKNMADSCLASPRTGTMTLNTIHFGRRQLALTQDGLDTFLLFFVEDKITSWIPTTHGIHVTRYIYLHEWLIYMTNVAKVY